MGILSRERRKAQRIEKGVTKMAGKTAKERIGVWDLPLGYNGLQALTKTRANLVSEVTTFCSNPTPEGWQAVEVLAKSFKDVWSPLYVTMMDAKLPPPAQDDGKKKKA